MEVATEIPEDQVIKEFLTEEHLKEKRKYREKVSEVKDFGVSVGLFRDILKAKSRKGQLFWFGLAIMALTMCIVQLDALFSQFFNAPSNTRISNHVNTSIRFPIITVCTYARVNATKIRNQNISAELLTYMLGTFKGMYLFYNEFKIRQVQEDLEKEYKEFLLEQPENFTLLNFFMENGFDCSTYFQGCMFQGTDFECCDGSRLLSEVGKCFTLNTSHYSAQTIPGPSGGMRLHLRNFAEEYPETLVNTNPDMGIEIHVIHPADRSTLIGSSPVVIFPGTHALVNLKARHQVLRETLAEDSCTSTGSLRYFGSYTYEGCFKGIIRE